MNFVEVLGKVIEISHSNLEIASRINAILNILASRLHFDEALVYTLDKDKRLSCRFMNGGSQLFDLLSDYRSHVGEGVVGTVAQKRVSQFYTLQDVPPRLGCLFYSRLDDIITRYKTFAFLPLADDSFLYGVLFVCSSSMDAIADTNKQVLSVFSRELGGILRAYDLLLSSKKRITELTTLSELGRILTSTMEPHAILDNIALITAKALNAWFATIKLDITFLKVDGQRFTSGQIHPAIEGPVLDLEAEALHLRRAVSRSDLDSASAAARGVSLFSTPVVSKERILGTITLCRKREQREVIDEQEDIYLLGTIASYISSGLENALLNIKLRDALRELGDAQRRLIEHEKLRSLGEMTASIAHEIKNPLVVIGGFTKRLAKKTHLDESEAKYVDIITKEVARLEELLTEILNYVKESSLLFEHCDLNSLMDDVLYLVTSDKVWAGVTIERHYDRTIPSVLCDVQQMKQAFLNILNNAFDAMNGNGTLTIASTKTTFQNKPSLAVSVSDTGGGIDPSSLDNIFNPFFTTKEKGSGLGLAISNKIVMHHGGDIEVRNKPGEGVTFTVYLPSNAGIQRSEMS
jgi:signal transduction histidine kinase